MEQNKGYTAFCDFAKNKSFSLIGLGVSNLPLVPFLYNAGAKLVTVRDLKKKSDDQNVLTAAKDGAKIILGEEYLSDLTEDVVIRSPGIRPDIAPFQKAAQNGSLITCETELFLRFAPCKTFAVTGSDGKTTTTTLVSKILSEAGFSVKLGGNIGKAMLPQLPLCDEENSLAVMELSSFQLMNCKYSPNVAIVTNLSENHLDWHCDMAEYLDAKKNILSHQKNNSVCVLNYENQYTKALAYNGKAVYFSSCPDSDFLSSDFDALYYSDEKIYLRHNNETVKILDRAQIVLPGIHNVENYMAAIGATLGFVTAENVLSIASTFGGVEHRIELVRELNGVKFYNSSIDSSPARSTAALNSFNEKVIMIAGGYDKNLDYSPLGPVICEKVKTLILCGATSDKIENAVRSSALYCEGSPSILRCKFDETAKLAQKVAHEGDKVILSPASASFDLFTNFAQRGEVFKKLVMELK